MAEKVEEPSEAVKALLQPTIDRIEELARMRRAIGPGVPTELVMDELAAHGSSAKDATVSIQSIQEKERGNKLFAAGRHEDALDAYCDALGYIRDHDTPKGKRARATLHSNLSACLLAMDDVEAAVKAAQAAIAEDETFGKGWLRLGAALEALDRRDEALDAYGKVSTNEFAAKRIAALRGPPVVVTAQGLSGVPERSLDPDRLPRFASATQFYCGRVLFPGEPLILSMEPRAESHDYRLRLLLSSFSGMDRDGAPVPLLKSYHACVDKENHVLYFQVMDQFATLSNVADDGCSRTLSPNSPEIPILLVAVWMREASPPGSIKWQMNDPVWGSVKPLRDMLLRNAKLVSEEAKRRIRVAPGFVLSVLTHVAAPEMDYTIRQGCSFPGCVVKCAAYRCSRCFVARYCGKEHMTSHWKAHKLSCVPLAQREPKVTIDCSGCYHAVQNPATPRTFPGVVVVKIQMFADSVCKISDPHGLLNVLVPGEDEGFEKIRAQMPVPVTDDTETNSVAQSGVAYFDADMSVEGRLVVYLDRWWKCTW
jgi:hypothetical protein